MVSKPLPRVSRRTAIAGVGAACTGIAVGAWSAGCDGPAGRDDAKPPVDLDVLGERYVRLALQLAKHQPSLVDVWLGPPAWADGVRRPAAEIRADLTALGTALASVTPFDADGRRRVVYLQGQVRALGTAAGRLLGESPSYHDEAVASFGYAPPVRDAAAMDAIRAELADLLPGTGPLVERYAAYRRAQAVAPARVESVFSEAVTWCRAEGRKRWTLPDDESMAVGTSDGQDWAGFSKPRDRRVTEIWASRTGHADVAHLLQLAAHEGIPGHHAQHVMASAALIERRHWQERALHVAFGPHRLFAEGAAEAAADLLLPLDTRIALCRDTLLPIAGRSPAGAERLVRVERLASALDIEIAHIAADYLSSPMSGEAVTTRLRDEALALEPEGLVGFIEKQRTRVLAYPLGRALVGGALTQTPAEQRWARLGTIATYLTLA